MYAIINKYYLFSLQLVLGDNKIEWTLFRLMLPDDANIAGNVHGGTILKMVEESGAIVATRWCNMNHNVWVFYFDFCTVAGAVYFWAYMVWLLLLWFHRTSETDPNASNALLVRIEHMDFLHPVHIGQVAHVEATIVYTSSRSLLVIAKASGEDVISGVYP